MSTNDFRARLPSDPNMSLLFIKELFAGFDGRNGFLFVCCLVSFCLPFDSERFLSYGSSICSGCLLNKCPVVLSPKPCFGPDV